MSSNIEAATALSAAGALVVPVTDPSAYHPQNNDRAGKKPVYISWQENAMGDPKLVKSEYTQNPGWNVGLLMGRRSMLICVDVDPRNGGEVWQAANHERLMDAGACLEITGSGGWHYYFAYPPLRAVPSFKPARGVEVLSDGGHQVVCTPSIHPKTKKAYRWEGRDLASRMVAGDLPCLPVWIESERGEGGGGGNEGKGSASSSSSRTVSSVAKKFTKHTAKALEEQLAGLTGGAGRHATMGAWVMSAVAAGADLDWIQPRAEEWMRKSGREPQHREVENWIREAEKRIDAGTLEVSSNLRPDLQFPDDLPVATATTATATVVISRSRVPADWESQLDATKDGRPKATIKNLTWILAGSSQMDGVLGFNMFTQKIAIRSAPPWSPNEQIREEGRAWSDEDGACAAVWIGATYGISTSVSLVHDAVIAAAQEQTYHPVRDWLDGLAWDGRPRIDNWLKTYLGATGDSDYLREVGAKWLISAVARIMVPGCKADHMLILEGPQGTGKSSALHILGQRWFSDALQDIGSANPKDVVDTMNGKWILEISELDSVRKAESSRVKAFVTRQVDRQRLAYARTTKDFPRQCIFAGTTNSQEYLRDETGDRRFWPVETTRIDLSGLERDVEQIWAEAVHEYRRGKTWNIVDSEIMRKANDMREVRFEHDEWQEAVLDYAANNPKGVSCTEVWEKALNGNVRDLDRRVALRIGSILRKSGYKHQCVRDGEKFRKVFFKYLTPVTHRDCTATA